MKCNKRRGKFNGCFNPNVPHVVWRVVEDRRKTSLPRASLFFEYESYERKEEAVERLKEQFFPLKQKIVLTSKFNIPLGPSDPNSYVKFIKNGNSHIVIGVETKTPAILLLTDIFDEGGALILMANK